MKLTDRMLEIARGVKGSYAGGLALLVGLSVLASAADPVASEKIIRQIGVMEKIIDQVLVDSPNFLVFGTDNARGLYIEQFGALFTVEASLANDWLNLRVLSQLKERFEVKTNEKGEQVIVIRKSEKEKRGEKSEADRDEEEVSPGRDGEEDQDKYGAGEEEKYEKGKSELIQMLLDYGETMTALRDGQWVVLAAFLKGSDFFKEKQISRLIIRAKIDDLRAHANGSLSASAVKSRIIVEEY